MSNVAMHTATHLRRLSIHNGSAGLMAREDQCVSNDNILSPTRSKYYHFSDVVWCQRFAAPIIMVSRVSVNSSKQGFTEHSRINSISLAFIAIKPHHRELGFDLTRIDPDNTDPCGYQLLA